MRMSYDPLLTSGACSVLKMASGKGDQDAAISSMIYGYLKGKYENVADVFRKKSGVVSLMRVIRAITA